MNSFDKLVAIFKRFPGIGPRQASRFVYHLLAEESSRIKELSELVSRVKNDYSVCDFCHKYFQIRVGAKTSKLCSICADPHRDQTTMVVVTKDVDLENIEKSHSYPGMYFVLGGSIPIMEKSPDSKVRIAELVSLVKRQSEKGLIEIILALSATTEGENTSLYLEKKLADLAKEKDIKISTLGRGLSTGTELEYSDADTIKNALKNRSVS